MMTFKGAHFEQDIILTCVLVPGLPIELSPAGRADPGARCFGWSFDHQPTGGEGQRWVAIFEEEGPRPVGREIRPRGRRTIGLGWSPEGFKTTNELASEHGVRPTQASEWKRRLLEAASMVFSRDGGRPAKRNGNRRESSTRKSRFQGHRRHAEHGMVLIGPEPPNRGTPVGGWCFRSSGLHHRSEWWRSSTG